MKPSLLVAMALIALSLSGCGSASSTTAKNAADRISEDEKHRLYSAALAASESPLDNETFKKVCREIGIYDAGGQPNHRYMTFVSQHIAWGTNSETAEFRQEINSQPKAAEYIKRHLSAQ